MGCGSCMGCGLRHTLWVLHGLEPEHGLFGVVIVSSSHFQSGRVCNTDEQGRRQPIDPPGGVGSVERRYTVSRQLIWAPLSFIRGSMSDQNVWLPSRQLRRFLHWQQLLSVQQKSTATGNSVAPVDDGVRPPLLRSSPPGCHDQRGTALASGRGPQAPVSVSVRPLTGPLRAKGKPFPKQGLVIHQW